MLAWAGRSVRTTGTASVKGRDSVCPENACGRSRSRAPRTPRAELQFPASTRRLCSGLRQEGAWEAGGAAEGSSRARSRWGDGGRRAGGCRARRLPAPPAAPTPLLRDASPGTVRSSGLVSARPGGPPASWGRAGAWPRRCSASAPPAPPAPVGTGPSQGSDAEAFPRPTGPRSPALKRCRPVADGRDAPERLRLHPRGRPPGLLPPAALGHGPAARRHRWVPGPPRACPRGSPLSRTRPQVVRRSRPELLAPSRATLMSPAEPSAAPSRDPSRERRAEAALQGRAPRGRPLSGQLWG